MASRIRSKSESLSSPPQKATFARHSSGSKNELIDVTFVNKSQTISPLARELKAHADSDVNISQEPVPSKKGMTLTFLFLPIMSVKLTK